ncbi:hypothetical protein [Streptomyces evansiae]|uniref:hypothetical protein n=1 Tax=Streptomyces evansiae TaxID=3075535 RepID=UPI002883F641|nr:hypothetical protein [Streptomyces sp. DSM 41859]MDT0425600.1 hypothetical protein [Streptomyces sp. DSM 41859]
MTRLRRPSARRASHDELHYSKTELLHRFPSKERLLGAILRGPLTEFTALRATWAALSEGPSRRSRAAADLVDLALRHRWGLALFFDSGLPDRLKDVVSGALDREIPLDGIPGGLRLTRLTTTSEGLSAELSGKDVTFRPDDRA